MFLCFVFRCLVSKLFDVCPRSTVEEMEQQDEVQIAWGTGIAGHVAESGEPVNIPDAYQVNILKFSQDFAVLFRSCFKFRIKYGSQKT